MSSNHKKPSLGYIGSSSRLPDGRGVVESDPSTAPGMDEEILGLSPILPRIAISGKLASGKTTAAMALVEELGFRKMSFADVLKEIAADIADWMGRHGLDNGPMAVSNTLKDKTTPWGREWLQWLGTECLRSRLPDIWIHILLKRIGDLPSDTRIVTDDVRFKNEAEVMRRVGFLLVRVDTPESVRRERVRRLYPHYNDGVFHHLSETVLNDWTAWDFTLDGGADIEEFKATIVSWTQAALRIDGRPSHA